MLTVLCIVYQSVGLWPRQLLAWPSTVAVKTIIWLDVLFRLWSGPNREEGRISVILPVIDEEAEVQGNCSLERPLWMVFLMELVQYLLFGIGMLLLAPIIVQLAIFTTSLLLDTTIAINHLTNPKASTVSFSFTVRLSSADPQA